MYKTCGRLPDADSIWDKVKTEAMKQETVDDRRNLINQYLEVLCRFLDDDDQKKILEHMKEDLPKMITDNIIGTVSFNKKV